MAFDPRDYNIETWLRLEEENLLQKECNVLDGDGRIIGQYKTRVGTKPVGQVIHGSGVKSVSAPSLYRDFTYDDEGNRFASVPRMEEWDTACEASASGPAPLAIGEAQRPTEGLLRGLVFDRIDATYPNPVTEVYDYSLDGVLQSTITAVYNTADRNDIVSVARVDA